MYTRTYLHTYMHTYIYSAENVYGNVHHTPPSFSGVPSTGRSGPTPPGLAAPKKIICLYCHYKTKCMSSTQGSRRTFSQGVFITSEITGYK